MSDADTPPPVDDDATPRPSSKSDASAARRPAQADVSEIEATVASEGPLVAPESAYAGLRPRDLGKALIGQQIGSVLLEEFVGGGGMGAVFRGRDVALQRTVAVKVLATHNATGGNVSRRFEIEAQSAARLDHPNIARIYHFGEDHGVEYIVFEFIDGLNLRDLVAEYGPQPVRNVVAYGMQIADALVHAWRRKVVHRDIKPSNILVTRDGQAKLVDMGLARMHQAEDADQELTATGATLGTFDYIAPEQARDPRDADIRSDIYSLGCTLFFLLTGKPPFPDGTALQKLLRHQGDQPPDIRQERPDVPRALAKALERMLAKRPTARQQDPTELLGELAAIAQPLGIAGPSSGTISPAANRNAPWRRHAPWVVPAALLLVLGLGWPAISGSAAAPRTFDELETAPQPPASEALAPSPLEDRGDAEEPSPGFPPAEDGGRLFPERL